MTAVQDTPPEGDGTQPQFDAAFRDELGRLFRWRRDVRRFCREPLPAGLIEDLLDIAQLSPSVGLSQPWRWVLVSDSARRAAIRTSFEACNSTALAGQAGERAALYAGLKLSGLDDAPCHLAVFAEPEPAQGHGLGRLTMPETVFYSTAMAIHTLWLAARAEGVGLGWVSILDPRAVNAILEVSTDWKFIGYLCLGYPEHADDTPELERAAWERRRTGRAGLLHR
jgi:5,6-dimethylbenzimidazole synthase